MTTTTNGMIALMEENFGVDWEAIKDIILDDLAKKEFSNPGVRHAIEQTLKRERK